MKRRILCTVLAIMLVCSLALPVSAAFNADSKNSVVYVYFGVDTDAFEQQLSSGSGFFVGPAGENPIYLITNYHVIQSYIEEFEAGELLVFNINGTQVKGRAKLRVYFDSNNFEEVYPVAYNEQKDVAILKLASPTSLRKPMLLRRPTEDMVGSSVYAVGYPGLSENYLADSTSSRGLEDISVTNGSLSRIVTTQGTGRVSLQITCDIYGGNSGGPLVNDAGEAIGINTWGTPLGMDSQNVAATLNYAVSIDEAIQVMNANGIPYELASDNAGGFDMDLGVIIGIAAGVAAIVVLVVVLVTQSNKKKKQQAALLQEQLRAAQQPVPRNPYVRSMAPQHGGMRVPVSGQAMLIGRSKADCAISFMENSPGVSGRHCSLYWDGSAFVLTDLRSTYGTFLQNGQKLTPGTPYKLAPGSSFWLGDKQNVLRLELE